MRLIAALTLLATAVRCLAATYTEIPIARSMADKGKYYLMEMSRKEDKVASLHKRVGVSETGYTRIETNCATKQYREVGYSEAGPDKINPSTGKWTDILEGSSKADLVAFVCSRK
jgi:hypothetical protein